MDISSFLRSHLKIRHLHVIIMLDETLSVSRAAERLNVTQAAVSRTLAEVEAGFGFTLFERHARGLRRTAQGRDVIRALRKIISEISALEGLAGQFNSLSRGQLLIGMQAYSLIDQIAAIVVGFKSDYPNVHIRLRDGILPDLLEDLQYGRVDIVYGRISETLPGKGLIAKVLAPVEVAIVAGPGTAPPPDDLAELMRRPWVLPVSGTPMRDEFDRLVMQAGHDLPPDCMENNNPQLIAEVVRISDRLALCPAPMADIWRRSLGLQKFAVPGGMSSEPLGIIYADRNAPSPAVAAFLKRQFKTGLAAAPAG